MNRDDNIAEGNSQLPDERFYKKLDKYLTSNHNEEITRFLRRMRLGDEISKKAYEYQVNLVSNTRVLYGTENSQK